MGDPLNLALVVAVGFSLVLALTGYIVLRARVRVRTNEALIVHSVGKAETVPKVCFSDTLVLPFQTAERVDLATHEIVVERRGKKSLRCRDDLRVDVVLAVKVRVSPTAENVLRAARRLGAERTGDATALAAHFEGQFASALVTVARASDFEKLFSREDELVDFVLAAVGMDLDGYEIDSAHFRTMAQTPNEALDPEDILDAIAIRKATERAGAENARTRQLELDRSRPGEQPEESSERTVPSPRASGYRSDLAAAEARVTALEEELAEARRLLRALSSV